MTKILEHASRVLAIMGIALIVWTGMGAQSAKASAEQGPGLNCWPFDALMRAVCVGWFCPPFTGYRAGSMGDDNGYYCCWS